MALEEDNDTLAPTKEKVLETYEKVKHLDVIEGFLEMASGYQFYNTSVYDFEKLDFIIANINDRFSGVFTEADRVLVEIFYATVMDAISREVYKEL